VKIRNQEGSAENVAANYSQSAPGVVLRTFPETNSVGKGDVVYYLPVAERILCLIYGFFRKTDSARFNIKKGLNLISLHARHFLFNLLLLLAISRSNVHASVNMGTDNFQFKVSIKRSVHKLPLLYLYLRSFKQKHKPL
jgi:hypothetical protein